MYRWDASYAVGVQKQFPDRFGVIKPVNANDPKVQDVIAEWAAMPGTVAIRIMMTPEISTDAADPGIVGDHGQVLRTLFDQAVDQSVGLADAAEAAKQHHCAVADARQRLGHALHDLVDHRYPSS